MKKVIQPLKGTRDFYPEEMAARVWLYDQLRIVSEAFGYQEYDGPYLESLELYAAKSSEELVQKQSFSFQDRGGDWITLRPELTPSLARMIAQRQAQLVYPLRWWSFGAVWRYERPQKGRTREFFQWNIDLIGVDTPEADAELIAIIAALFRQIGLKPQEAVILVNDRRLTNRQLERLGVPVELRPTAINWIDRRDKMRPEEWDEEGIEIGLTSIQLQGVKEYMGIPDLWQESEELSRVFAALEAMGAKEYVKYDAGIIRGLPYYTGTVFEAFDVSGSVRRAILGGGRYNNLMAAVGGDPLPAVGFAMGDVVISLILQEKGLMPKGSTFNEDNVLVTVFDKQSFLGTLALAAELRKAGIKAVCYPEDSKLSRQFKFADRTGIRLAVVLGPDEQANNLATVKDLRNGNQQTLPRGEAAGYIKKLLESGQAS